MVQCYGHIYTMSIRQRDISIIAENWWWLVHSKVCLAVYGSKIMKALGNYCHLVGLP